MIFSQNLTAKEWFGQKFTPKIWQDSWKNTIFSWKWLFLIPKMGYPSFPSNPKDNPYSPFSWSSMLTVLYVTGSPWISPHLTIPLSFLQDLKVDTRVGCFKCCKQKCRLESGDLDSSLTQVAVFVTCDLTCNFPHWLGTWLGLAIHDLGLDLGLAKNDLLTTQVRSLWKYVVKPI